MSTKALKQQLIAAIAMVLVAAIALGSSTYAWFVNNAQVTATGANVQAATAYSLLISKDNSTYGTTTAFTTALTALTPVSTTGELASSMSALPDGKTPADNDVRFVTSKSWENNLVTDYTEVAKDSVVTGEQKYFYRDTVYVKSAQNGKIYIDGAANTTGIMWANYDNTASAPHFSTTASTYYSFTDFVAGAAKQTGGSLDDKQTAYNAAVDEAIALMKTIRVGFMVTNLSDSTTAFNVYQFTGNLIDNTSTTSINTTFGDANGVTKATKVSTKTAETPTFANYNNGVPVITAITATGSQTALATTSGAVALIDGVTANTVYQLDTYIWMEGCDYDTTGGNLATFDNGILKGIQFGFCLGE